LDNALHTRRPIYMDHHATTPVDPRVLEVMLPYFTEVFGNASSTDHEYGAIALTAVETARAQIAAAIGAAPAEIVFTSGATESDNLALVGCAHHYADRGNHIITCVTEHKAVLDTCKYLESTGFDVTYLPVDKFGTVDPNDVRSAITNRTILVSIMMANNEIGTIAPIAEIGKLTRERQILFHSDATQAFTHIPIDVQSMNIDLLSVSAHKIYGPKGIGALYVRRMNPRVRVDAMIHGGGHERGMRSGTLNVPAIVGFGEASTLGLSEMKAESKRVQELRDRLWILLQNEIDGIQMNGHPTHRISGNLNVFIPGVQSRSLIVLLKNDLAVSTGSACTTATVSPSHVLLAIGQDESQASSCIRIGLGKNTAEQVDYAANVVKAAVAKLRNLA